MGAHIEWIRPDVGILRVGRQFQVYYDPYEFAAVVDVVNDTVTFKGAVSGCIGMQLVKERTLIRAFLPDTVRFVTWERVKNGIVNNVVIDLAKRAR